MSTFWTTVALTLGLINLAYLFSKDKLAQKDKAIEECIKTIKYAFETSLKKQVDYPDYDLVLGAEVEALQYVRFVNLQENKEIRDLILKFALAITDFKEDVISTETFIGEYNALMRKIYSLDVSYIWYIRHIFKKNKTR